MHGLILSPWQGSRSDPDPALETHISWTKEYGDLKPTIELTLIYKNGAGNKVKSVARLQRELWQNLCDPEAFATTQGKPAVLPGLGRPVAVGAIAAAE